jgi:signal transduction histidine kinase
LQHEINNPLGATFGATYLLKNLNSSEEDRQKAIELINESSKRIQQVLKQLVDTSELESVTKGGEELYQIPGDKKWN